MEAQNGKRGGRRGWTEGVGGDEGGNSCISHTCLKHLVGSLHAEDTDPALGELEVIDCIQYTVCRVASGVGVQDGSCELELSAQGCNTTDGSVGVDSFTSFTDGSPCPYASFLC